MSNSIVFYLDRNDTICLIDPDTVPHSGDTNPLMLIVVDVINAGFNGARIDALKLSNGRYLHVLNVDIETPEGAFLSSLAMQIENGQDVPTSESVLRSIQDEYSSRASRS